MRISDWSSDVCSSDLSGFPCRSAYRNGALVLLHIASARHVEHAAGLGEPEGVGVFIEHVRGHAVNRTAIVVAERRDLESIGLDGQHDARTQRRIDRTLHPAFAGLARVPRRPPRRTLPRSEEPTPELQSLMRISYAVFCLKKKKNNIHNDNRT